MADICACSKKSTNIELVTIDGERWWQCNHQGCELRVSGAKHFWRESEHQAIQDAAQKKGKAKAAPADAGSDAGSDDAGADEA